MRAVAALAAALALAAQSALAASPLDGVWQSNRDGATGPGRCAPSGFVLDYRSDKGAVYACRTMADLEAGRCDAAPWPEGLRIDERAVEIVHDDFSQLWERAGSEELRLRKTVLTMPTRDAVARWGSRQAAVMQVTRDDGFLVEYRCAR
jgi:hypothetical protein